MTLNFRSSFFLAAFTCFALLAAAHILERVYYLEPCPLCILQRGVFWIMAFLFLLGAIHHPKNKGRFIYAGLTLLLGLLGALLAMRQIWLQHLPSAEVPACTAGFDRLLAIKPLFEVLQVVLTASGECAKNDFSILSLSIPSWTLLTYISFMMFSVILLVLQKKRRIP